MERTDTSILDAHPGNDPNTVARFFVEEPGCPPQVVLLSRGRSLRIGRGDDQDLRLSDQRTSRAHAQIDFDGARVTVRDVGSSNGTWVGETRISAPTPLLPGTAVRVGGTRVVLVPPEPTAARGKVHETVGAFVAVDPASVQLFSLAKRLAASDLAVLIQGETGSGKEVVARALHRYSHRAGAPFMAINCASLPDSIAESELFGHERGSFTGAYERKAGVFESAHGGVLMLDEVGELSAANQARLLRTLQERVIMRVGGTRTTPVDVRVVGATNRDLAAEVARGRFREDLYFRLNGVTITVPPLRERPRDIVPLAEQAVERLGGGRTFGKGFTDALLRYAWPGNVRELFNAIECAFALAEGPELRVEHLPPAVTGGSRATRDRGAALRSMMDEIERGTIVAALDQHNHNQSRAAIALGISRRALIYKMERYGLKPPPKRLREE